MTTSMRNKAVYNNKNNIYRKQRKCKRIIMARQTDKLNYRIQVERVLLTLTDQGGGL